MNADDYREGYRVGFAAGKESALREVSARVPTMERPAPAPRRVMRKCQCGHSINTHNELGYCQARHDKSTPKGINGGCFCDGFRDQGSAIRVTTDHIGEEETMFFTAEDAEWNG